MQITNIFELFELLQQPDSILEYLQRNNVLARQQTCSCGRLMLINKKNEISDKFIWRCPSHCSRKSIREGSFFAKSKLPLKKLVVLTYFWLQDIPTNRIQSMVGLANQTLADWNNFLFESVSSSLLMLTDEERMIGGEGRIVEIDESLISKKYKYYRGRRYPEIWIFGGTERGSKKWFGQMVFNRDRETLTNLITRFIKPGTIIYSDRWPAYWTENYNLSHVPNQNFIHLSVNHKIHFKDPVTQAHTNKIEGQWGNLKVDMRKRRGMSIEQKVNYIDFRLWLSRQNYEEEDILDIFWRLVGFLYPV